MCLLFQRRKLFSSCCQKDILIVLKRGEGMNGRKFNQAVFERDDEKKKQEIIYERIWILGGLWRVIAYEYSSFIFLFLFLPKQSMKMLQCLSWKCCELLCFSWPKHRPTWKHFNCFQQNIDIIFNYFQCYFFNVIINTSVWEANTKFVHLLRNKFSSNTHYIFKNKLRKHITNISKHHLPEWQINSTIYADVAF